MENKIYLGDGAYASIDELGDIELTTENGISVTNRVCLGDIEADKLFKFYRQHKAYRSFNVGERVVVYGCTDEYKGVIREKKNGNILVKFDDNGEITACDPLNMVHVAEF